MTQLEEIRQIIRAATCGEEFLTFGGSDSRWWQLDDFRLLPDEPALYALGLKLGVQYERTVSRIVYFGSTIGSLRNRIRGHATQPHNDWIRGLCKRFPQGVEVSFQTLRGLDRGWLRELEDAAMQEAHRTYGCFPICNVDPIVAKYPDACRGFVRILPCEGLPFPQRIDTLKCGDGILRDNTAFEGGRATYDAKSRGIQIVSSSSRTSNATKAPQAIGIPHFKTPNLPLTLAAWDVAPTIYASNVALWPQEKFERIVSLCRQLKRATAYGQSKIITFDAPTRVVPTPDTWGEVALLEAREFAGTFHPETRLWLKVRFEKTLLGQAILEPDFYYGEDKSDLPQATCRDSIEANEEWSAHVANIPAELPLDFQPKSKDVLQLPLIDAPDPVANEHLLLLRSAQEYDLREAAQKDEYDRSRELDQIRTRLAHVRLEDQIEARYRVANDRIKLDGRC